LVTGIYSLHLLFSLFLHFPSDLPSFLHFIRLLFYLFPLPFYPASLRL
jgi:hypothetical protein